jgi:HTH-type transcriptional regulator / antitoxin MqsA
MKCPLCGKGNLVSECRDLEYEYRGRTTIIPEQGEHCAHCNEAVFTDEQGDRYLDAVKAFRARVDAEPLAPAEIRSIRKKLKLTQKEAGELFGGGIRAFSQYERGETRPGKALDQLLRLLERHPEMLVELWGKKAA